MVLIDSGDWLLASILFIVGRIGFGAANVFYDALLPHVAREEDQEPDLDLWLRPGLFGWRPAIGHQCGIDLHVGWQLGRTLLITLRRDLVGRLFHSHFPPGTWKPTSVSKKLLPGESLWQASFGQIWATLHSIREYRELFRYLVSFLIYNDGIGIIITVAAIYGAELGFGSTELILAILLVQFVGIPYSLVFGNLPSQGNKWQPIYVAFVVINILMLPLVGILGSQLLPQSVTGTPSPDFVAVDDAVGQGSHALMEGGFALDGQWTEELVTADLLGTACKWYAFWCNDAEQDAVYVSTAEPGGRGCAAVQRTSVAPDPFNWPRSWRLDRHH